jgi:hypothetical protein
VTLWSSWRYAAHDGCVFSDGVQAPCAVVLAASMAGDAAWVQCRRPPWCEATHSRCGLHGRGHGDSWLRLLPRWRWRFDGWFIVMWMLGGHLLVVVGVGSRFGWRLVAEWWTVVDVGDGRWCYGSQSSPDVCECGRSWWASVAGCGELSVGRGERRRRVGNCVVVELLIPSQYDEVWRFEWWCTSSSYRVAVLSL